MSEPTPDQWAAAMTAQLRAEVAASETHTIKSIATVLDMNYTTLTTNLKEGPLKVRTVLGVLDVIGLDPVTFMTRARERVG